MIRRELEGLSFEDELARQLLDKHGPIMSGENLWRTLGYSSGDAFRYAKSQGRLEIKVFSLPNRRGTFAFTQHVADWIKKLAKEVTTADKPHSN